MDFDVVIIGSGPAGLCFARSLAGQGLRIAVLERQGKDALVNPIFDGREIALTQRSAKRMRELGLWERIDVEAIAPLRDAKVLNGPSLFALQIDHRDGGGEELGYLVSNYRIRKAAYEAVADLPDITLMTDVQVKGVSTNDDCANITLGNGEMIRARLLAAADNRFSETRRMMGIAANMHDFGRTMLVCVMTHDVPHQHVAWEWFDYGQTLALLPMNGSQSSVVITLPPEEMARLMAMDDHTFSLEVQARFKQRLGNMQLTSTRHTYPLVTVYPKHFVAKRFALIGDAAVGMHPVTAHGFNFGLEGIAVLSREIIQAHRASQSIAADTMLARYEQTHRRATMPLFVATHAIAKLYGDDRLPARLLRNVALRLSRIPPFRRAVARTLTAIS
ncbi:MAG: 5-demethoxyubiquinol-8 5-hydroxylase UbiM [Betaproteobacteria bacterium]|nr:5-demethoxyubiquinol-8 5-hydroxylase UbiM [Betaproteobacteria bacterium]